MKFFNLFKRKKDTGEIVIPISKTGYRKLVIGLWARRNNVEVGQRVVTLVADNGTRVVLKIDNRVDVQIDG